MYRYRFVWDWPKASVAIETKIARREIRMFMGESLLSEVLAVKAKRHLHEFLERMRDMIRFASFLLIVAGALAQAVPEGPAPTIRDVPYGEHPKQTIDFYKASSGRPTP